ncbi:MAG TPA: GMC family oxidoreductase [Acidimicrobiales bacterium]|nr:GMC family oxidoreductase [Acidimicrobiales bacterium]
MGRRATQLSTGAWDASALAGLCSALLPPEHGGPDPHTLSVALARFLDRQPAAVSAGARLGASALDAASVLASGSRLARRPADERIALLRAVASVGSLSLGLDGLKALVLLVHGADTAAADVRSGPASSAPARPDAPLEITAARDWPGWSSADVVVVGSGAGGAMAARTLARVGLRVVIVEEGRRHTVEEFRSGHPLDRFASLYRDGGATAAVGWPPVVLPIGRAVGGTTVVNSGTCYRTPPAVLRRWRDEAGLEVADPDRFAPYLDEVWRTLQVAPVPARVMGRNGRLALAGAAALGWSAQPIDRNAPGCGGCCQCSIGCPRNAKFGVHLNALPEACAAGAHIVSEARVRRVLVEAGRAVGIEARRPDGSLFTVRAGHGVVVSAGTTETPLLLRRSGVGAHPLLGRNMALHPAVGVSGRFEEPVTAWRGVLQSAAVDEFHEQLGILVEATATPPGMGTMQLPGLGPELLSELAGAGQLATLGAMVADLPGGRVMGRRHGLLRYDLSRRDGARLVAAIGIMGRLLLAAGATEVLTGIPGHERVGDTEALERATSSADPRRLHVAAFHPVGTAGAGADPERFPVGPDGALRGIARLWVADGSVLPTCPEVNPQVTIMGLALAIADGVADAGSAGAAVA